MSLKKAGFYSAPRLPLLMRRCAKWIRAAIFVLLPSAALVAQLPAPPEKPMKMVHYDGAHWHMKGDGMVCCPCKTPCPCRTNSQPSYGHCEATQYLRVREGAYGAVDLSGMQLIESGGMCAISYHKLSALYFDRSSTPAQQAAYMKIVASFSPEHEAEFMNVRPVSINAKIVGDHLFTVAIPGVFDMLVDRNWGMASAPMPEVAASDSFANTIQYAQNIRYRMHDAAAGLDFDYSRRQANYRSIDLTDQQYRAKSMLVQFVDGVGWFNAEQLAVIQAQKLTLPDLDGIRLQAMRLRETGNHQ